MSNRPRTARAVKAEMARLRTNAKTAEAIQGRLAADLGSAHAKIRADRLVLDGIRRLVGDHFAGLPADRRKLALDGLPEYYRTVYLREPRMMDLPELTSAAEKGSAAYADYVTQAVNDHELLLLLVEASRDDFSGAVHAYVGIGEDNRVAYGMSRDMLRMVPLRDLVDKISREIAIHLSHKLHAIR